VHSYQHTHSANHSHEREKQMDWFHGHRKVVISPLVKRMRGE
jgi:hypothetical protein